MTARDPRFLLAAILLLGYYAIILTIVFQGKPLVNPDIVKDGMIVLGPPVGAVFSALFRTDATDEKRAENTGDAFKAIAAAQASPAPNVTLTPGQSATVAATPDANSTDGV